ncbi:DUF1871 family protein [Paenibacillus sp. 1P07SE]|uniref:DUF1871 family protein n=1 Tax=Paenibacillus sp. 1P07SE TaxID=3132209 RepID=UPI0039A41464
MNSLSEKVAKIINDWDPINLLPLFPPDEYSKEIDSITQFLEAPKNVNQLAEFIYSLFLESFGKTVFDMDKSECIEIANQILE